MRNLLEKLEKEGWIKKQKIALSQIEQLAKRALKDLSTAGKNVKDDPECAFDYSYKAMLRIGRAIIFSYGYRPRSARSHKTVVEACGLILGSKFSDNIDIFDRMRKVRNQFTYDPVTEIAVKEAKEALGEAKQFLDIVLKIIKEINPQLSLF
ncbi:MAG: HEPN domain-containing protein [Candidatus Margulisiibacteriota bacterium]